MEPPTKKECEVRVNLGNISGVRCGRALPCPVHSAPPDAMEGDHWEKLYEKFNNETFETTLERWGLNQGRRLILRAFIDSQFISKGEAQKQLQAQKAAILSVIEGMRCDSYCKNTSASHDGYHAALTDLATRIQAL